jgi:hypothetical protein
MEDEKHKILKPEKEEIWKLERAMGRGK